MTFPIFTLQPLRPLPQTPKSPHRMPFSGIPCGLFSVAPAGVEPAMGESKSPALPLGDGASVIISIFDPPLFVKPFSAQNPLLRLVREKGICYNTS